MPYYRRSYKKRFYKKKNFSKFNLYKNRSSKSQANQIYRLNKKINAIEKKTKPEIQPATDSIFNYSLVSTEQGNKVIKYSYMLFDALKLNYHGKLLRLQNIKLYGSFGSRCDNDDYVMYLRLVAVQSKTSKNLSDLSTPLFNDENVKSSIITCPLMSGFGRDYKLLCDKVYKVDGSNNSKLIKLNLNKLKNLYMDQNGDYTGDVKIFAFIYSSDIASYTLQLRTKYFYVDEA